jgi:hypothetical protein
VVAARYHHLNHLIRQQYQDNCRRHHHLQQLLLDQMMMKILDCLVCPSKVLRDQAQLRQHQLQPYMLFLESQKN